MRSFVESLENGRLLSVRPDIDVTPNVTPSPIHKGVLAVNGTAGDDNITVGIVPSKNNGGTQLRVEGVRHHRQQQALPRVGQPLGTADGRRARRQCLVICGSAIAGSSVCVGWALPAAIADGLPMVGSARPASLANRH